MARSIGWRAGALAATIVTASPALAEDYKPVACTAHQLWQGRPLHAPVTPVLEGAIPETALPSATAAQLDSLFDTMRSAARAQALGIAVGRTGEGLWSRIEAPAGKRLWWASAGKTFVAVVVLQLAEEGKLSLDDSASRWIKGVPNGDAVTVRDLLAHTSGVFSANEDLRIRAKPHYLPPAETLAILRRHGAMFCPGSNWRYSNSGYDLLAMIVEAVDRRPLPEAIAARIAKPLGLTSIVALRAGQPTPDVVPPALSSGTPIDVSTVGAGGPIAGDPADMVRFWSALLGGRLLRPATMNQMFGQLHPMFDPGTWYGLGVMVLDVTDGARTDIWLGHAGGAPGASAMLAWSPADRTIVAVALTGDGPAAAVANAVLKSLRAPLR
ncbi:MAG: serine hydrolase domain-containing protein [Sphingomonas sp.]|jgi:D-alanyl-D-alanine carboxypeptidase|uniref:serine hydrolase domain-containing protein n=1 Tax=Sphingomonas sp. TaxID=28214 RepID=UPI003567ED1A